jgi:hypothetical protein
MQTVFGYIQLFEFSSLQLTYTFLLFVWSGFVRSGLGFGGAALPLMLAALVPKPRVNLTRFHGVFVEVPHQPNSKYRALVTPAKRGKGNKREENCKTGDCKSAKGHAAMTWAQRLKRVFKIDITTCEEFGGTVKVVASIEAPVVIKQIFAHYQKR